MDLFKSAVEVKQLSERVTNLKKELRDNLLKKFVNLPYEVKEVEADYDSEYYSPTDRTIKVYYPILNTPEGFKKENEKFYREYSNCINHEYTLKDSQGRKVIIWEQVIFNSNVYRSKKAHMSLNFNIPSPNIELKITISGEEYRFKRLVNQKRLIKEIIGKDDIAKYIGFWAKDGYSYQEGEYNKLLETLGKTKEVPTLKELASGDVTKIEITDSISAIVEARVNETSDFIWLKNSMYSVAFENMLKYSVTIKIKPYLNETIKLEEQRFEYDELKNEDELRKGKTFDELVELLESFQKE